MHEPELMKKKRAETWKQGFINWPYRFVQSDSYRCNGELVASTPVWSAIGGNYTSSLPCFFSSPLDCCIASSFPAPLLSLLHYLFMSWYLLCCMVLFLLRLPSLFSFTASSSFHSLFCWQCGMLLDQDFCSWLEVSYVLMVGLLNCTIMIVEEVQWNLWLLQQF